MSILSWVHLLIHMWIHVWIHVKFVFIYELNSTHVWIHIYKYEFTSEYFFSWIHIWIYVFSWLHIWIQDMNSDVNSSWCPWIHGFSWILARYHGFWPFFMGEIIFKILSEEYCEKHSEKYSDFMEVLKRILNWIYWHCVQTCSVWQGQPILLLLLQSHLPHYQLVCLTQIDRATAPIPNT